MGASFGLLFLQDGSGKVEASVPGLLTENGVEDEAEDGKGDVNDSRDDKARDLGSDHGVTDAMAEDFETEP